MATKKSLDLFINAFSVFNKDRYSATPAEAALFDNLVEADLQISAITEDSGTGVIAANIVSTTRNFRGDAQSWTRATLQNQKILPYTVKTLDGVTDQASFLDAISHIEEAGIYQVAVPELSNATAILVIHAPIAGGTPAGEVESATKAAVLAAVKASIIYDFEDTVGSTTSGNTYVLADNYIKDAVYHAPVGVAYLDIPATDYGHLDATTYQATM